MDEEFQIILKYEINIMLMYGRNSTVLHITETVPRQLQMVVGQVS